MVMIFTSVFCCILLVYIMLDLKPQCANPFGERAMLLCNVYDYMIMAWKGAYGNFRLMVKLSNWFSCKIKSWRDFNWLVAVCVFMCVPESWCRHQRETFSRLLAICAWDSLVNSPHKGQWRGALINGWVNNPEAGDLRHHCAHHNVTVMINTLRLRQNSHSFTDNIFLEWKHMNFT